jgi:hypothetical protein
MKPLISFRHVVLWSFVLCTWGVLATPVAAQYFGQNKVQYRQLDFKVLHTAHFDIYFYPEEQAGTDIAARMAERWYARLSKLFRHELRGRQPLILYASPTDFQQTNVIPGDLGEGTGGVTEPVRRRIVLPLAGPRARARISVRHHNHARCRAGRERSRAAAALVHRGNGGVLVAWTCGSKHRDVDARCRAPGETAVN